MNKLLIILLLFCVGCSSTIDYDDPDICWDYHPNMLNNGVLNDHMKRVHGAEFLPNGKKCPIDHYSMYKLKNGTLEDHLEHCVLFKQEEIKTDKTQPRPFPMRVYAIPKELQHTVVEYDPDNDFYQVDKTSRERIKFIPNNYSIMTKCGDEITISQTTCRENHKEKYIKDFNGAIKHFKEVHGLDIEHVGWTE